MLYTGLEVLRGHISLQPQARFHYKVRPIKGGDVYSEMTFA